MYLYFMFFCLKKNKKQVAWALENQNSKTNS